MNKKELEDLVRKLIKEFLEKESSKTMFSEALTRRRSGVRIPAGPTKLKFFIRLIEKDLNNFRQWLNRVGLGSKTASNYFYRVRKILNLDEPLTYDRAVDLITNLIKTKSHQTVLGYRKALKWFSRWLYETYGIYIDFDEIFRKLGVKWTVYSKIKYLDLFDEDMIKAYQILKENNLEKEAILFAFATVTGMRKSEIFQLEKKHIDLKNRLVLGGLIDENFLRKTKKFFFTFFTKEVRELIKEIIDNQKYIFKVSDKRLKKAYQTIKKFLGKRITLQTCREFFTTKLLESGLFSEIEVNILQGRIRGIIEKHYFIANWKKLREKYDQAWSDFAFE